MVFIPTTIICHLYIALPLSKSPSPFYSAVNWRMQRGQCEAASLQLWTLHWLPVALNRSPNSMEAFHELAPGYPASSLKLSLYLSEWQKFITPPGLILTTSEPLCIYFPGWNTSSTCPTPWPSSFLVKSIKFSILNISLENFSCHPTLRWLDVFPSFSHDIFFLLYYNILFSRP